MKSASLVLQTLVGVVLVRAFAQVLYYGVEQRGDLGDVYLVFENGRTVVLGCAGDGTVLVRRDDGVPRGAPPYTTVEIRELEGVSGKLTRFLLEGNALELAFEEGRLQVTNDDDELRLRINDAEMISNVMRTT